MPSLGTNSAYSSQNKNELAMVTCLRASRLAGNILADSAGQLGTTRECKAKTFPAMNTLVVCYQAFRPATSVRSRRDAHAWKQQSPKKVLLFLEYTRLHPGSADMSLSALHFS
jgi:hypothetical protein